MDRNCTSDTANQADRRHLGFVVSILRSVTVKDRAWRFGKNLTKMEKKTKEKKKPCREVKISWVEGLRFVICFQTFLPAPLFLSASDNVLSSEPLVDSVTTSSTRLVSLSTKPPSSSLGEADALSVTDDDAENVSK